MAYTINLTDGSIYATIADGTINTSSSMILVGKNYAGYGEFLDENFIHLLENGSNTVAPGAPLTGQLWWDKANNVMKVYNGTTFKTISAATASGTQPTSNVVGDLWFDTTNQQLKAWNGTSFILIGPASSSTQGTSGPIVSTITDQLSVDHVVLEFYVQNTLVAILSKDATFTPLTPIAGFATIAPGFQLNTSVSNALLRGTATDSLALEGISAAGFLSATSNDSTTGTLAILNDTGLTVGVDQDAKLSVSGNDVTLQNQTQNGNIIIKLNVGGISTSVMSISGSTGTVNIPSLSANISGNLAVPGANTQVIFNDNGSAGADSGFTFNKVSGAVTVKGILNANGNGVGNIGSSGGYFNTIFATATTALYADVAERFAADEELAPGTVVELGGVAEITRSIEDLSDRVFGVISTRPAHLMNGGAGPDSTHPPVAMTGRVPVRAIGAVRKGDRLVSGGNGLARAARSGEATPFNTIGRALEDKLDTEVGMVESIVSIK